MSMKHCLAVLSVAAFTLAIGAPAFAKTETLKGQIVDQSCYAKDMASNKGVDHKMPADTKDCAIACAKKGAPMALLTSDGKVYTIAGGLAENKNAKLVPHVSHTVEITGDVMNMSGKMMITSDAVKMVSR
jgi:hypothetical protein